MLVKLPCMKYLFSRLYFLDPSLPISSDPIKTCSVGGIVLIYLVDSSPYHFRHHSIVRSSVHYISLVNILYSHLFIDGMLQSINFRLFSDQGVPFFKNVLHIELLNIYHHFNIFFQRIIKYTCGDGKIIGIQASIL